MWILVKLAPVVSLTAFPRRETDASALGNGRSLYSLCKQALHNFIKPLHFAFSFFNFIYFYNSLFVILYASKSSLFAPTHSWKVVDGRPVYNFTFSTPSS